MPLHQFPPTLRHDQSPRGNHRWKPLTAQYNLSALAGSLGCRGPLCAARDGKTFVALRAGARMPPTRRAVPACIVSRDRFSDPAGPPGQGGEHLWQIKGATVGECDIAVRYARGFQPEAAGKSIIRVACACNDGPAGTAPAGPPVSALDQPDGPEVAERLRSVR